MTGVNQMAVYRHGRSAELGTNKAFEFSALFCESSALTARSRLPLHGATAYSSKLQPT